MKQIPEHIFKTAEKYGGIPMDFHEDEDALTIVMTDGRKISEEKESGTKKRIQRAEAEQAEAQAAETATAYDNAAEAKDKAFEAMKKARERAEALRAIADKKTAQAATQPTYSEQSQTLQRGKAEAKAKAERK